MIERYLEYRRASFLDDTMVLETLLRQAWQALPTTRQRIIERFDGSSVMGLSGRDLGRNGFAVHCVRYVEQQSVGVVNMIDAPASLLGQRDPGNSENFLNTDFFAVVLGNNLVTLGAGKNGASLRTYLRGLFIRANLSEGAGMFDLLRIPDADKVARIDAVGVSKIRLDLGIEEATAIAIAEQRQPDGLFARLRRPLIAAIEAVGRVEGEAAGLECSHKGTMRLEINVPNSDLGAAKDGLDAVATEIVQDEDASDYVIILRSGEPIRPNEIAVKKRVRLERFANTFDVDEVMGELATFMSELRASGQLEL